MIKNIAAAINKIGMTDSKVSFDILLTNNVPILEPTNESKKYKNLFFSVRRPFL